MGSGGSIPLVGRLREAYPDAALILWGAQDSDLARIHAANESVALGEIEKLALAEVLLLEGLSLDPPILAGPRGRGQRHWPIGRRPKDPPCAAAGRSTIDGAHGAESATIDRRIQAKP
jgi:hypothetical protein